MRKKRSSEDTATCATADRGSAAITSTGKIAASPRRAHADPSACRMRTFTVLGRRQARFGCARGEEGPVVWYDPPAVAGTGCALLRRLRHRTHFREGGAWSPHTTRGWTRVLGFPLTAGSGDAGAIR